MENPTAAAQQQAITAALVSTTRSASHLANEDIEFHRSSDRSVAVTLDQQNERLLALARRLLRNAAGAAGIEGVGDGDPVAAVGRRGRGGNSKNHTNKGERRSLQGVPQLKDADALELEWSGVVDVVDGLLERADTSLDEFSGAVRRLNGGDGAGGTEGEKGVEKV